MSASACLACYQIPKPMSVMLSASQPNRPIAIIVSRLIDDEGCFSRLGDCFDVSCMGGSVICSRVKWRIGLYEQRLCLLYVVFTVDHVVLHHRRMYWERRPHDDALRGANTVEHER